MVLSHNPQVSRALEAAAQSSLTADLDVNRPWLRLVGFVLMAALLVTLMTIAVGIAVSGVPALRDQLDFRPLPVGPLRLNGESAQVLLFAAIMGGVAFGILAAAALTYHRSLTAFLWPGRRFRAVQLGIGFVVMAGVSVLLTPVHLAMGGEWSPPLFDPAYLERTRLTYVLAMTVGLLVAAAAEEVVFRGVLLRLSALVTRRPLLLCLANGLLFSAIHLDPDPVAFVARTLSGMVWTWAALRLGGLEFAIGAHLANNLFIALFLSPISEAGVSRQGEWIKLGPEVVVAVITIVFVERLARRYVDPASLLPSRSAA